MKTYQDCIQLVETNPVFVKREFSINGFRIVSFNYRLAQYKDFIENDARELRGLTFVFNRDNTIYKRFVSINKFWNINETEETLLSKVETKEIKAVYDKLDGSMIQFIELPDLSIHAKTQNSFDNEQCVMANKIINKNTDYQNFISIILQDNCTPIFELTTFKNKIVVHYPHNPKLTLLHVRNNKTGEYIDSYKSLLSVYNIDVVSSYIKPLKYLLKQRDIIEVFEGWVIKFTDGQMVKLKTQWYIDRHRLLTESIYYENFLVEMILTEKIDDIIAQLNQEKDIDILNHIKEIQTKLLTQLKLLVDFLRNIDYNLDRKYAALEWKEHKYFPLIMQAYKNKDFDSICINYMLKQTNKLEKARNYLSKC